MKITIIQGKDIELQQPKHHHHHRHHKHKRRPKMGMCDPYVVLRTSGVESTQVQTKVKFHTANPKWNETFSLPASDLQRTVLFISVFDRNLIGADQHIGSAALNIGRCFDMMENETQDQNLREKLQLEKEEEKEEKGKGEESNLVRKMIMGIPLTCTHNINNIENNNINNNSTIYSDTETSPSSPSSSSSTTMITIKEKQPKIWILLDFEEDQNQNQNQWNKEENDSSVESPIEMSPENALINVSYSPTRGRSLLSILTGKITPSEDQRMDRRFHAMYLEDIRHSLHTGDVLLVSGCEMFSRSIQIGLQSTWSHVAMIVRNPSLEIRQKYRLSVNEDLFVWESESDTYDERSGGGVQLTSLRFWLLDNFSDQENFLVCLRTLNLPLHDDEDRNKMQKRLESFMITMFNRTFERKKSEMIRGAHHLNRTENLSSVFCSELINASYREMGLLVPTVLTNNFSPKDWSSESRTMIGRYLIRGAFLSDEIRLRIRQQPHRASGMIRGGMLWGGKASGGRPIHMTLEEGEEEEP